MARVLECIATPILIARALEERVALPPWPRLTASRAGKRRQLNQGSGKAQARAYFAESAGAAARFLVAAGRPAPSARSPSTAGTPMPMRAQFNGRLATLLGALDGAIGAIETGMGDDLEGIRLW